MESARIVAGVAYALSPRMVTSLGAVSIEVLPMAVAPWGLVPLVGAAALRAAGWALDPLPIDPHELRTALDTADAPAAPAPAATSASVAGVRNSVSPPAEARNRPDSGLSRSTGLNTEPLIRVRGLRTRRGQGLGGVLDQLDHLHEGGGVQAAGPPGGAARGQHVVGSCGVVPERHRGVRAEEDGPGVADPRGHRPRVQQHGPRQVDFAALIDANAFALVEVAESLRTVGRALRQRSPEARVLFVDYLTLLPATGSAPPLREPELTLGRHMATTLQQLTADAARVSGCGLVEAAAASSDHHAWSASPWTTKFGFPLPRRPAPLHPNAEGMRAVADLVVAAAT